MLFLTKSLIVNFKNKVKGEFSKYHLLSGGGWGSCGKSGTQTRSSGCTGNEGTTWAAVTKSPKHSSRSKTEISPPYPHACGPRLLPPSVSLPSSQYSLHLTAQYGYSSSNHHIHILAIRKVMPCHFKEHDFCFHSTERGSL